jgi:hypothetical protein
MARAGLVFATLAMFSALMASPAFALSSTWRQFDANHNGTVNLSDVQTAAGAMFDRLDKNKSGRLTVAELRGRLSASEIRDGDTDNDRTKPRSLSKDDYLAVVAKIFAAADASHTGKLDAKETRSTQGRKLLLLMR